MMNNRSLFGCRYSLFFICPLVCNTMGLHNSSIFIIVQCVQWFTLHHNTYCSQVHYIVYKFTSSHNQINGASLQDNSQLRYTLYTSSVQDLYLPPRFLLQRQSHAYCQGYTLEPSINYDLLLHSFST